MKKLLLLTKSLLAVALLCVGQNAWGETISKTVYSCNFQTATWAKESGFGTSTVTINGQSCTYASGALEGLALQGGSGTGWTVNGSGLTQGNGTRNLGILNLKAGDEVIVNTAATISNLVNGTSTNDTYTGTCKFSVTSDGTFGFSIDRNKYTTSIIVNRQVETVSFSSWNFQTATWAKESGFGTSTVTINGQSCTYASGALEGLALQGGSGTGWTVNGSGLTQGNGTRNLGILNLKAGDVVVVNTAATISNLVNGTSVNDTYTGECKFSVTSDGTFGYSFDRNKYTTSIVVYRALSDAIAEYNDIKVVAEALRDVPNDNSAANSTLSSVITTQNAVVASATTYAQISTAKTALLNAVMTYIAAANPTTGNQFDLTFLLTNPDVEGIVDWGDAAAQGWFTDIPRTDLGDYNNFAARTNLNSGKNGIERYTSNVCTTANEYALYQKVTLPAGNYSFDAYALANNASNIVMAAGNAEGDAVTSGDFTAYSVDFTQASNSETKLGIKIAAEGTNAANWMAITGLKLYKEAPTSVSATIGSNGYTTFASPYPLDLTAATQSANGFTAYRASAVNDETVTFKDDVNQNVVANTGVLLQGTANAVVTIPVVASGSALADNALQVNAAGTTFAAAANTTYYGMNKGSDPLTFGTFNPSSVAIPASKAYLALTSIAAREVRVVFGDITGVENVEAAPAEAKAKEGKFIENGKLVIVKNGQKFNAAGAQVK